MLQWEMCLIRNGMQYDFGFGRTITDEMKLEKLEFKPAYPFCSSEGHYGGFCENVYQF